jgi:hypothetical protein
VPATSSSIVRLGLVGEVTDTAPNFHAAADPPLGAPVVMDEPKVAVWFAFSVSAAAIPVDVAFV